MKAPHLYLTGYRGSGKSTIAKLLAARLQRPAVDLDDRVEATAGKSIYDIFATESEVGFRHRETVELERLTAEPPAVVSLGGGAILSSQNRDMIARTGRCVWIDVPVKILVQRIASDETTATRRPSLTNRPLMEEVTMILNDRRPLYALSADYRIDTGDETPEAIARRVLHWWANSLNVKESP